MPESELITEYTLLSFSDRLAALERQEDAILDRLEEQALGDVQELADRLDSIHKRPEVILQQFPPWESDPAVPLAENVEVLKETQKIGTTHLGVRWTNPDPSQVERFEIYIERGAFTNESPAKVWEGLPPAAFSVNADQDTSIIGTIRTVMKGGVGGSTLAGSPTFASSITLADVTAGDIADESIGDAKLDRTTDPIVVGTADIGSAAITNAKIANAAVDTAQIANAAITNALIANLAVDDAKINDLAAAKVLAGTMSAVNISGGTYTLTSSPNTMTIDGTNGFRQQQTSTNQEVSILNGTLNVKQGGTTQGQFTATSTETQLRLRNPSGAQRLVLDVGSSDLGDTDAGYIGVDNSSGNLRVAISCDSNGNGEVFINGDTTYQEQSSTPPNPVNGNEARVYMKDDKLIIQYNDAGTVRYKYLDLTGTGVTWVHTTTAP